MRGKPLTEAKALKSWLFLFAGRRDQANAQNFVQTLIRVGRGMGFNVSQPET
jgi:hypothetical protein